MSTALSAQQYLYVERKGELPSEKLVINDIIYIKIEGHDEWIKGAIKAVSEASIKLNDRTFYFSNIEGIRVYNPIVKILGTSLWGGGLFFTSIFTVNRLINDDQPVLKESHIIFGLSTGAAGAIVSRLARKTYLLSEGYKLKVIDLKF